MYALLYTHKCIFHIYERHVFITNMNMAFSNISFHFFSNLLTPVWYCLFNLWFFFFHLVTFMCERAMNECCKHLTLIIWTCLKYCTQVRHQLQFFRSNFSWSEIQFHFQYLISLFPCINFQDVKLYRWYLGLKLEFIENMFGTIED